MSSLSPSSSQFSEIAIRLPKLDAAAGSLAGTRPVVIFADQGQQLIGMVDRATAAGGLQVGVAEDPLHARKHHSQVQSPDPHLHQLEQVIFVLDRSASMGDRLLSRSRPGEPLSKMNYLIERLRKLNPDYLPEQTRLSLVTFDHVAEVFHFGEIASGALREFKREVGRLREGSGTDFIEPLSLCTAILRDNIAQRRTSDRDAQPGRSIICFVTDGHGRYVDTDMPAALMQQLRDQNATVFVLGIGEDYSMPRIMKLAGYAGASSWSHLPIDVKELDVFDVQLPELIKQVLASEHYLQFSITGNFTDAAAVAPSVRFTPVDSGLILPGYVREARGIVFEKEENLRILLRAGRSVSDLDGVEREVPIVDLENVTAEFDRKSCAQDFARNTLLLRGMLRGDINLLREMQRTDRNPDQIAAMIDSLYAAQHGQGAHGLFSNMAIASASYKRSAEQSQSIDPALYSGNVGPLSAPPPSESIPSLPEHLNPAVYDQQGPRVSPHASVEFIWPSDLKGQQIVLSAFDEGKSYVVGREKSTEQHIAIRLTNVSVSRRHCEIWREDGAFYIKDLGSTNGTAVNGRSLKPHVPRLLHDGDLVQLLWFQFRFKLPST
jgi:hypothetical protein